MEQHKISVIMSTYNEEESHLRQAIESILNQTYKNIEFLIILDNPQNEYIEAIIQEYSIKDNRIRLEKNNKNMGLTKSLNKGIDLATGKYIARMDADDISLENRLHEQYLYIQEHNIDILGSFISKINENDEEIEGNNGNIYGKKKIEKLLYITNVISHPTWFMEKEIYQKVGKYKDISSSEDYEFLLRALQKNITIDNIPKVLLKYRIRQNGISKSNKLKQLLTSEYIRKYYRRKKSEIKLTEIEKYLAKRCTETNIMKYNEASKYMMKVQMGYNELDIVSIFLNSIRAIYTSKYCIPNIYRIIVYKVLSHK